MTTLRQYQRAKDILKISLELISEAKETSKTPIAKTTRIMIVDDSNDVNIQDSLK
jgi:hypothetical protein